MGKIRVMHQCAHNTVWNIDSFMSDNVGDGLIISPSNLHIDKVNDLPHAIKKVSFFDPQYYLPKSEKKKLNSYPYFPNTYFGDEDYSTQLLCEHCYESADKCVKYQITNSFKYIVIPAIYNEETSEKTYNDHDSLIIVPFLDAIKKYKSSKPILLTAVINNNQLIDEKKNIQLLNFLTSYPEITGIYLIPNIKRAINQKRISDINILNSLLKSIDILKMADLEVHIGYTDIEGFLLSIANPDSISIGAYENSRRFGIDKFMQKEDRPTQPNARLYSNVLLQWIDTNYIDSLKTMYDSSDELFEKNKYLDLMLRTSYNWHFTKKEPYMHYFISFTNQISSLPDTFHKRYNYLYNALDKAKQYFQEIDETGIVFDTASNGEHIEKWMTSLNWFAKYKGVKINV